MRQPAELALQAETNPRLPPGQCERVSGYGVMGVPFASGHLLGLRRWTASSVGEPFTSVWHRDPAGRWTFYESSEVACTRYFGDEVDDVRIEPIEVRWDGPQRLCAHSHSVDWTIDLTATLVTRMISAAGSLLPLAMWRSKPVLTVMGRVAGWALRVGKVNLTGLTSNDQRFDPNPRRIWRVSASHATVNGEDLGPIGPLPRHAATTYRIGHAGSNERARRSRGGHWPRWPRWFPNDQSREAAFVGCGAFAIAGSVRGVQVCGSIDSVELGVHLPLMEFRDEGLSMGRLQAAVDAAARSGFVAVSANDHFVFSTPWLDGPTALAAVIDRSGEMTLATTIALAALRGPVPLAKALVALDVLSGGRVIAGVGPGSSERDYDALGIPFHDRWKRFDESVRILRALLGQESPPDDTRYFTAHDLALRPAPVQDGGVPLWIGSWGSAKGLRRVARLGDGWLASAYNTTPDQFASANGLLGDELRRQGRHAEQFPNALVTMWTWITESQSKRERILADVLAPLLNRPVDELRERVCVGSAEHCAELLSRYASSGCQRVYLWLLGDEPRQIELAAAEIAPHIKS